MADQSVSLLFRILGDSSNARGAFESLRVTAERDIKAISASTAAGFGLSTRAAGSLAGGILSAGSAFAAAASSGLALAVRMGEVGGRFNDLSKQTGLSVETLSGLDSQAKKSGTSLEDLSKSVLTLQKNLLAARNGDPTFQSLFRDLGIKNFDDALKDADGTLKTVSKSLADVRSEGERNAVGVKVMGKSYNELAVLLKDTGGDLDMVVEAARRSGEVMSAEAADGASKFNDQLADTKKQLSVVTAAIGQELMPTVQSALENTSTWLQQNRGEIQSWAGTIAGATSTVWDLVSGLEGAIDRVRAFNNEYLSLSSLPRRIFGEGTPIVKKGFAVDVGGREIEVPEGVDPILFRQIQAVGAGLDPETRRLSTPTGEGTKVRPTGGKRGGGRKKGGGDRVDRGLLSLDERETEAEMREVRERIEREYELRLTDLEGYINAQRELLNNEYESRLAHYDREEALARKETKGKEQGLKLAEVEAKRREALRTFERESTKLDDEKARKDAEATAARREKIAKIEDADAKRRMAQIEGLADFGVVKESEAAGRIGEIQLQVHDRAVRLLQSRLRSEREGSAEYIRLQTEIGVAEVERAELAEETARRVEAANKREVEAARLRLIALQEMRERTRLEGFDVARMEVRAAGREGVASPRDVARNMARIAEEEERERHSQRLAELDREEQEQTFTSLEELAGIVDAYHARREQMEREHQQRLAEIKAQGEAADREHDPFGPFKDLWDDFKEGIDNTSGSISASVGAMSAQLVDSFHAMEGALKQGIAANLLYGASLAQALKKALAEQLAHISAEATVQGIKHAAWALGSLAFGDFRGAALHGAASAAFFGLAALTGKAAGSLAKSAGMQGAAASGGSSAGQVAAYEDARTRRERERAEDRTRVEERRGGTTGDPLQPRESRIVLEVHTKNEPGTLTETIIKTVESDISHAGYGRLKRPLADAWVQSFRDGGDVRDTIKDGFFL